MCSLKACTRERQIVALLRPRSLLQSFRNHLSCMHISGSPKRLFVTSLLTCTFDAHGKKYDAEIKYRCYEPSTGFSKWRVTMTPNPTLRRRRTWNHSGNQGVQRLLSADTSSPLQEARARSPRGSQGARKISRVSRTQLMNAMMSVMRALLASPGAVG